MSWRRQQCGSSGRRTTNKEGPVAIGRPICGTTDQQTWISLSIRNHNIKRWQYICDHNSGKSRSIFITSCTVVSRKTCAYHLNNVLTLPSKNENITFVRSFYVISGCTSFNDLCIASMTLLMYIAAYFVNMFGTFLCRLSLFSLLFIFSSLSSLIYTVLCELRLIYFIMYSLNITHCIMV